MTWNSSYTEDPWRLRATVYSLVGRATQRQGFVHPRCITLQVSIAVFVHFFRIAMWIAKFQVRWGFVSSGMLRFFFQFVVTCVSKAPSASIFKVEQTTVCLILTSSCLRRSDVSVCTPLCPWVLVAFGSALLSWTALVRPHLVHHQGSSPSSAALQHFKLYSTLYVSLQLVVRLARKIQSCLISKHNGRFALNLRFREM